MTANVRLRLCKGERGGKAAHTDSGPKSGLIIQAKERNMVEVNVELSQRATSFMDKHVKFAFGINLLPPPFQKSSEMYSMRLSQ